MSGNTKASLMSWLLCVSQIEKQQRSLADLLVFAQGLEALSTHIPSDQVPIHEDFDALNVRLELPIGSAI
jgi:hypothetical protein